MGRDANQEGAETLRYERNRFVAFAFASADAFLETDVDLKILYATGAIKSLLGLDDNGTIGASFSDSIASRDRARLRAMAVMAQNTGRSGPLVLGTAGDEGAPKVELGVTFLPNRKGRFYFTLKAHDPRNDKSVSAKRGNEPGGLLNAEDFTSLACDIASQHGSGADAAMTLLEITGLDDLESHLDAKAAQTLMDDVAANLQIHAIDGAAARLSSDRYGVVHKSDLDLSVLEGSLANLAKTTDPSGKGVSIGAHQIDLAGDELSETDLAKAVIYTISQFSSNSSEFTVKDLKESYGAMLDETRAKIAEFKRIIVNQQFDVAFQPIVDLTTRAVHHYEALVRMKGPKAGESPYQTIAFAEDAGVIHELDLAMCRQVLWDLEALKDPDLAVAVNLSGRSLQTPSFIAQLTSLLSKNASMRHGIMFEITESSRIEDLETTNNIVQGLRELGHKVCLDDFGAGAAAFQYLRALQVDCVKIDGIYVQEASHCDKSRAFLRSIVSLCRDLEIETVGEMIETEDIAQYLCELGVDFGQGYLFGRPEIGLPGHIKPRTSAA